MRIAQIAPLYESVPPRLYGGTERIVAYLTDALVAAGHEVTLYASGGSRTRAKLVEGRAQPLRMDPALKSDHAAHLAMLDRVRADADRFDILHFHIDLLHFPMFEPWAERSLTTLHGRLDMQDLSACYRCFPNYGLISISDHQRSIKPELNWARTIYHGLPTDLLRFNPRPGGGYLAFLGRISPEKGPQAAIKIAKRAGLPLKIAAKVDAADQAFFANEIEHLLDHPLIDYVGEIGEAEKSEFLGNAAALLFPIAWPEPFGLVMIEALACGTPVVAFDHGSVPEVIDHGLTGYIVDDLAEAVAAVPRALQLDRRIIRATFERRFSASTMAATYVDAYRRLARRRLPALVSAAI